MPLYDYECNNKKCRNLVERYNRDMVTSNEDVFTKTVCPKCSKGNFERVIALPHAIVRSGGAWATAIRKDQVDFSSITMDEGIKRMSASKGA